MSRILTAAFVLTIAGAGMALGQTTPAAPPAATSPAVPPASAPVGTSQSPGPSSTVMPSNRVGAPVAGRNSFTEAQARSRIEKRGYSSVTGLAKDDKGIWRGKAMKGTTPVEVAVDYKGNVVAGGGALDMNAKTLNEADARRRFEAEGYTNVTELKMDAHSMWRGRAMKAGKPINVAIDDQGNVVTRK